jgi:hypothetical protein
MAIKPETVTAETLRNILQAGQDRDNMLVRAYSLACIALKGQDMKPLGARLLTHIQKTIPTARYRHAASMTYIDFNIEGQEVSIFLSYNARFETASLAQYNTPCTTGATERTARRRQWLDDPEALERLAAQITAYNEARYTLQQFEGVSRFPDSLNLKGLRD